ncbi:Zn(II)2Cys6 transcription factor [Aspergillus stella-maris]|uniref:Zn(II)2Cys6 transcription factor n=1 Tax=Aspergillus stella-maris TaxID=1810926 RepID=UPI003CCCB8E1
MATVNLRNARSAPHSKNGCLVCRRRKKKCDERRPTCAACQRNGLDCVWPPAETVRQTRRPRRRLIVSDNSLPAELAAMVTVFHLPGPDLVRRLLHHFSQYGPMWLTSQTGNSRNIILFQLFPEAMESPFILHCVLMIAAEDLLKYDPSVEMQAAAVEYYGRAISGLREALGSGTQGDDLASAADQTLLAVALFCLHESQNYSDTARIIPHLNAAATLLRGRLYSTPPNLNLRRLLVEMFCYFFSITSFTNGVSLDFHNSSYIFESPFLHDYLQTGTIVGTSQKAFPIIFRLSRYLSNPQNVPLPSADSHSGLLNAATELQNFRQPFQISPGMTSAQITDGITFELYRLAYLIHIRQIVCPTALDHDDSVQDLVSSFMFYLSHLPPDSPSDGFICWPLVVVGIRAVDRTHRTAIANKLKSIYQRFRSEIFSRNLSFLRRVWREEYDRELHCANSGGVLRLAYPALLV